MMFHSFCMCKKENDKEINEWYNEENWGDESEFANERFYELA